MKLTLLQTITWTALICLLASSCQPRTIYLVRHAEKVNNSPESPLEEAGQERAQELRKTLEPAGIEKIYCSQLLRTRQTAQPLAEALHLVPELYAPDTTSRLAPLLLQSPFRKILVVGHSDRVPELIQTLTSQTVHIGKYQYDQLFVIRIRQHGDRTRTKLQQRKYGKPSPTDLPVLNPSGKKQG